VRALQEWLKVRGSRPGPLFTRIRDGRATLERLSAGAVNQAVKEAVKLINCDPEFYGAHSLRSTFVTTAHTAGADVLAIMEVTRHKTAEMVREYLREVDPFAGRNPIAGVL
jgi:integrase